MIRPLSFVLLLVVASSVDAQSLWNPDRRTSSLVADITARDVGDILTIIIQEKQTVKNKEDTELKKESTLDAALTNFDVFPNMFNTLPAAKGSSARDFKGEAKYDKEGTLETKLGVVVIDVQPNGNLVVEGSRAIIVDGETKTIRITGIVRRWDVSPQNTVMSEMVANASIAYEGSGTLTRTTNRGWLGDLLDFVWPF